MFTARKLAIALAVLMLAIVVWGLLLESNAVTIIINGQQVTGPLKGAIGAGGLVVALIALFCAAILLVFVFAGIGVIVLGLFVIVGVILAGLAFPFLLPLLIPLAILWGFVAIARRTNNLMNRTVAQINHRSGRGLMSASSTTRL